MESEAESPVEEVQDEDNTFITDDDADTFAEETEQHEAPAELGDEEMESFVNSLAKIGFTYKEMTSSYVVITRNGGTSQTIGDTWFSDVSLPRSVLPNLMRQLGERIVEHPIVRGFAIPTRGYAEFILRSRRMISTNMLIDRLSRLLANDAQCRHSMEDNQLPILPYILTGLRSGTNTSLSRVHLSSPNHRDRVWKSQTPLLWACCSTVEAGSLRRETGLVCFSQLKLPTTL